MNKKKQMFLNGVILLVISVMLAVYFTVDNLWGIAQVVILILLIGIAAMQFALWYFVFEKPDKEAKHRSKKNCK